LEPLQPDARNAARASFEPPLATAHEGWLGLPTDLYRLPGSGEELGPFYQADPMLLIARSGSGRRWYTSGTRTKQLYTAPRMIELVGAGYEMDRGRWEGLPGEVIAIRFPAATLARLLHNDAAPFDLPTRHELFDDRLAELAFSLWAEAQGGSQSGALYVEGLTLAMAGLLVARHGAVHASPAPHRTRFNASQRSRLREFVAAELSTGLCVERLAKLVAMSPDHFSRVFKASFGVSPHAYVVEQRLEAACQALRHQPERSLADVASGCGFSSQSHFSEVFRRRLGTTPARWRSAG
jgi:AraC family transcriptional regulator